MNKRILSWCLFDFANSSYSAVIAAVIFPVYYTTVIAGNESGLGDLWWGRAISLSMAVVALTSPFMGGIADYAGFRKRFLIAYTLISVVSVASLTALEKGMYIEGFLIVAIANIGMEGGLVFYNSYLPLITSQDKQGRVSGWGFAIGYAGSIIALLIALLFIKQGQYTLVWLSTALFFVIFALPAFLYLPSDPSANKNNILLSAKNGIKGTIDTLREIMQNREQRKFLASYLLYEDGVNTVIVFSSIFAATTLKFSTEELILLYLAVQITALSGAFIMAKPIDTLGPKKVVTVSLILWIMVSVAAYFVYNKEAFFAIAFTAGLGLGTIQAASRAFFAQFIPSGKEAEYFGIYALVGKTSAIIGPLIFGYMSVLYGSQRPAILSIVFLFLAGMTLLYFVKGGMPVYRTVDYSIQSKES